MPPFQEVRLTGVSATYSNGAELEQFSILESLGGGVSLFDIDCDGNVDIVYPCGGTFGRGFCKGNQNTACRNLGDMRFCDVSVVTGLSTQEFYSHGALHCDVNQDGFSDVLITGYGGVSFFTNQGDGTFIEVSESSGLHDLSWSSSAACGDISGDGIEDFYVAHYVDWSFTNHPDCYAGKLRDICSPRNFNGVDDTLFVSDGAGGFRNESAAMGLRPGGKGLGVLMVDFDADRDVDIYVANDTVDNFLYENTGEGVLREVGVRSATAFSDLATPDGSMGADVGDFNMDLWPDIWVTNYQSESPALYRNEQNLMFQHISRPAGVKTIGNSLVGWGTLFFDADRDGDLDIVISHGHVIRHPVQSEVLQHPALMENVEGRKLVNVAAVCGDYFIEKHEGRGVAAADLDSDGDQDLVFSRVNAPMAVLENQLESNSSWLALRIVGTRSPRTGVGASVTLQRKDAPDLVRYVRCGYGYASSSEHCIYWGITEPDEVQDITIAWPSGKMQTLRPTTFDTFITVIENRNQLYEQR
ncbi:MAG: CRTAC1 family protein [Planctomycetaceae bacterium]